MVTASTTVVAAVLENVDRTNVWQTAGRSWRARVSGGTYGRHAACA